MHIRPRSRATRLGIALIALIVAGATGLTGPAAASHYRGGDISYQQTGAPTNVALQSTTSFRCSAFFGNCATQATPGTPVNIFESVINFGDGTQSDAAYIVVAANPAEDWFTARKDVTHNYPNTTRRNAFYASCCTISSLNNNNDASFQQFVDVNLPQDANSPKTSVPPVVNVGSSGVQTFLVPATDPGGQTLFWRLANGTESGAGGGAQVNPPGLSINSANGQVSWNTTGVAQGLWHATVVIEARSGGNVVSATHTTFLINVGQGGQNNQPPAFVTPPSPADGTEFTVAPGSNLSFNLQANDPDAGDTVTLVPGALPPGATFNQTPGNPATGAFSFTPTAAQDGQDFVVNFTAQDGQGGSVFRSYTIKVRSATGVDGWMGGEGSLTNAGKKLNYAYLMDCDPNVNPKFAGKLDAANFKVSDVTAQTCTETAATQAKPSAPFDTMEGNGTGTVGTTAVTVEWKFVDGGVAESGDSAAIKITRTSDSVVLFNGSASPPGPYQTAPRAGRNTANPGNCPC